MKKIIPECAHTNTQIIELASGSFHKAKKVCSNCRKFISWHSLKTKEQQEHDRKEHIRNYYKMHPEKDKYKSNNFTSIRDIDYAFSDSE